MSGIDELLTADEVAELLQIPRSTGSDYARGWLPAARLHPADGRSVLALAGLVSEQCVAFLHVAFDADLLSHEHAA